MIEIRDYDVIEEIGRGGMATVYRAMQPSLNRHVALKVLPPHFVHDEEFVIRFRREALAIGKLRHPNIVKVYEFHDDGELFYLVMELIEGGSLSDMIKKASDLPIKFTAEVTAQMGRALHHAHENGFVHRDIKPSNILLDNDGRAVLTDFGITKAAEGTKLTKTAAFSGGTSEYMSPEQAKGMDVDARTDLYSLGVVWFEMVTGRCPFEKENPFAVIHSQIYDEPPKPSEFNPDLDPEIEEIILKLLEKDADKRFQNGLELTAAIEKLTLPDFELDDLPVIAISYGTDAKTRVKMPEDEKTKLKIDGESIKEELDADSSDLKKEIDAILTDDKQSTVINKKGVSKLSDDDKKTRLKIDSGVGKNDPYSADDAAIVEQQGVDSGKQKEKTGKEPKVKPVKTIKEKSLMSAKKGSKKRKRTLLAAAVVIGLTVMIAGYFTVAGYFGIDALHHQFKTTPSTLGDAKVTREINVQTVGDSSSYVIALRVREGKGDIELRESIPKSLAASVDEITFESEPTTIIEDDPVVMWKLRPDKEGTTIIYRVKVSKKMITEEYFDEVVKDYNELPKLDSIKISPKIDTISERQTISLRATGILSDESSATVRKYRWTSSDPLIASVDQKGELIGVKAGKVEITVTAGDVKALLKIVVLPILDEIIISPKEHSLLAGQTAQFSVTGKYTDGSKKVVSAQWSSSDTGVGTIDGNGILTAISGGKIRVVARSNGKEASASIIITKPRTIKKPTEQKVITDPTPDLPRPDNPDINSVEPPNDPVF